MLKVTKLREVTRNDLFPSADMVVSMSREFGVPLTAEDFGGGCAVVSRLLEYDLLQLFSFTALLVAVF